MSGRHSFNKMKEAMPPHAQEKSREKMRRMKDALHENLKDPLKPYPHIYGNMKL